MLTGFVVVIILQYTHVSNHYGVHLKLMQRYMSIVPHKTSEIFK